MPVKRDKLPSVTPELISVHITIPLEKTIQGTKGIECVQPSRPSIRRVAVAFVKLSSIFNWS